MLFRNKSPEQGGISILALRELLLQLTLHIYRSGEALAKQALALRQERCIVRATD